MRTVAMTHTRRGFLHVYITDAIKQRDIYLINVTLPHTCAGIYRKCAAALYTTNSIVVKKWLTS